MGAGSWWHGNRLRCRKNSTAPPQTATNLSRGKAIDPPADVVNFGNFVEFRLLNTGNKFFKIWLELVAGTSVTAIFRDDINGGNDSSTQSITSSGFVEFLSPGADIRNVVFIPIGETGMWLDDLTFAADNGGGGGGTTPEPRSLALLALGIAGFGFARLRARL